MGRTFRNRPDIEKQFFQWYFDYGMFKTEVDMKIDNDLHFVLSPGCNIFFEPENTGCFFFVDFGLRYRFYFEQPPSDNNQNSDPIRLTNAGFVFSEEKETLVADSRERIRQHEQAFSRLVEMCNQYPDYTIIIIGHAVNPYWLRL